MLVAEFFNAVPSYLRLALAIGITVGVSVLFVYVFHSKILAINASPKASENDPKADQPPSVRDISGRLIGLTTFSFVFLLGFGFGQFWGTAKDARDAVRNEATDYRRVVAAAERLPPTQGPAIISVLDDYRKNIINVEWPLMASAQTDELADAQFEAADTLTKAVYAIRDTDDSADVWEKFSAGLDDLLSDGLDRNNALPSARAVSNVILVFVLGLVNLFAIALFQPAHKKAHLTVVAMMAALTGFLLFALVEISNPYLGGGAITSRLLER